MSSIAKKYNRDIRYMFIESLKSNDLATAIDFLEKSNRPIYQLYLSKIRKKYVDFNLNYAEEILNLRANFEKIELALANQDYKKLVGDSIKQWHVQYDSSLANYRTSFNKKTEKVDSLLNQYFEKNKIN